MSLTTRVRNKLIDAINTAFDAVGNTMDNKMPKSKDNRSPVAWEYFVSYHILTRARVRFEAARKAAIAASIIFDHEKAPREPGTNDPIYEGDHVIVWLTVRNPATRVSADVMSEYLIKHGVDAKVVTDAYMAATSKMRPAHEFKASLAVETLNDR